MTFECLYPSCGASAIKSHSQQRMGQLATIAEAGHVYGLQRHLARMVTSRSGSPLDFVKLGIRQATTFSGFCGRHDADVFASIEGRPLRRCDSQQAAAFFLRAVAYEFSQKRRADATHKCFMEEIGSELSYEKKVQVQAMRLGAQKTMTSDVPFYFELLFSAAIGAPAADIETCWVLIDEVLPISTCCVFSPMRGNHDEYMMSHSDEPQPFIGCSIVPREKGTHVVLSWPKCYDELASWVVPEFSHRPVEFINTIAFAESEDTVVRCSTWEGIPETMRAAALEAMRHEMFSGGTGSLTPLVEFADVGEICVCGDCSGGELPRGA